MFASFLKRLSAAALLSAWSISAQAAPAFGNDRFNWNPNPGGSTNTQAFTVGAGSDRILFVTFAGESANSITGITYGGASLTAAAVLNAGARTNVVYYKVNPASGSNNIVTSWAPGYFNSLLASAFSYNGVNQVAPFGTTGNSIVGTVSGGYYSVTVTPFAPTSTSSTVLQLMLYANGAGTGFNLLTTQGGPRSLYQANMNNSGGIGLSDWNPASTSAVGISNYVTKTGASNGIIFMAMYAGELLTAASPTPTPSVTPTFSATFTPTSTISPTSTPTPSATPSVTPSLPLVKSANVSAADFGDTVTYTFSYTNDSGGAVDFSIWDSLPAGVGFIGCDNGCSQNGLLIQWSLPVVAPGTGGSVSFWGVINGYPLLPWNRTYLAWSPPLRLPTRIPLAASMRRGEG
jgi:uncharacterized repeat protein (TIGR01451 family)